LKLLSRKLKFLGPLTCFIVLGACLQCMAEQPEVPYTYTGNATFDIGKVPFSRFGSYMAFSMLTDTRRGIPGSGLYAPAGVPGLYLRNLHGGSGLGDLEHPVFRIELVKNGSFVNFRVQATPTLLALKSPAGEAEFYFDAIDRIRFRARGVSLRLTPVGKEEVTVPKGKSHWQMFQRSGPMEKYTIWPQVGNLMVSDPWNGIGTHHPVAVFSPDATSDISEGEIDTYDSEWAPPVTTTSFESGLRSVKDEYQHWVGRMPAVAKEFGPGAELAAYVNWSTVVAPKDFIDKPTMLMSKNWMAMVWSWDHCFNAMAVADRDPELAWQQFMVLFDNQEVNGALPDGMRENFRAFTYSKPPIHGWVLAWMMRHGQFSDTEHIQEAYGPLVKWTEWYFRYRDSNHNGLPEYSQGNDSGWDNSTVFVKGVPVETPDLSAFLVLQMDTLATMAEKLGKHDEADEWHRRSLTLLRQMLDQFWKGDHFVAIQTENDSVVDSESLLLYIPIILGNKLPPDVQQKLVSGLMRPGRFRTAHGFASEALTSPLYTPDGYWRGPIWAPSSMLLAEGLDSMGQKKIAHDLRKDFCEMAQKSGMAENYDAKSGRALRDPAYTWTSSVYLIFAHQLWSNSSHATSD
jgi:putative isomerase